ncbi:hypothetical protein Ahy_A01g000469 [Arachis hypogaea]|uniref:Uncharacterized protein n=1 Tax=Arachis hypogaea TaxID=3818 RepID=A0A445EKH4_ARAHY|nr:hypothetical protein Ahy_A01g000469 [Arachis hypogaea]
MSSFIASQSTIEGSSSSKTVLCLPSSSTPSSSRPVFVLPKTESQNRSTQTKAGRSTQVDPETEDETETRPKQETEAAKSSGKATRSSDENVTVRSNGVEALSLARNDNDDGSPNFAGTIPLLPLPFPFPPSHYIFNSSFEKNIVNKDKAHLLLPFPSLYQPLSSVTLPSLKHSLSFTLQHFFPFSSNLIVPPQPHEPLIRYQSRTDSSLSFTVAESNADFVALEDGLDGTHVVPLMAIQVTILPNSGFIPRRHFMKFWANCCKEIVANSDGSNNNNIVAIPFHDRSIVKDPNGLKKIYQEERKDLIPLSMSFLLNKFLPLATRHKWVSLNYSSESLQQISTFVVTSSLIWVSMIQLERQIKDNNDDDELCHFGFLADCGGHLKLSIPSTYFGNCLMLGFGALKRGEIVGENGIIKVAVNF